MRLTLNDIKRHNELLDRVFDYFQEQMRDITDIDERDHLRHELVITGLSVIALRDKDDFASVIAEAASRVARFEARADSDDLITDGQINSKLRIVEGSDD